MRPKLNALAASIPSSNRFVEFCCSEGARAKAECWGGGRVGQPSVGYCIPLLTLLRAAPTSFAALKGDVIADGGRDAEKWRSAVKLLHVNGCHIEADGRGAKLVCEDGYMDNVAEWQQSYAKHTAAIESCAGFINATWDVDKDEDAADRTYSSSSIR
jgi:hypothetical protein